MATKKSKAPQDRSSTWKQRFELCDQRQRKSFESAKKYYNTLYAVFDSQNSAPWRSQVFVPILASKAWDLISRLSDIEPIFDVTIKGELDVDADDNLQLQDGVEERERKVEAALHEDYRACGDEPMKLRVFEPLVDAVAAGTGYAYAPWIFGEERSYARPFDEQSGQITDHENVAVKTTKEGRNGFEPINFFNVFKPKAASFWKMPYLIVRGQKPMVDMKKSGLYQNLEKANTSFKMETFDTFNQARNNVLDEQTHYDDTVDTVTFYECWERTERGMELTVYAEGEDPKLGWVEIRPTSIPYWHNTFPIVPFYIRKKSFSTDGESLFENNRTLQSATNDLFNHYLDNWNLSIDSMIMYEDGSLTNDFIIEPGGEITYTGEAPKQYKFPDPDPQQLSVVMDVLEKGIEQATVPQYLSGVPDSGMDKTQGTATGVSKITEAATEKVGFMRDNFKQSMKMLGRIWLSNRQQFMDSPTELRINKNGQKIPALVMPGDFQGELDIDVDDDSMTPVSKSEKRDNQIAWQTQAIQLQNQAIQQSQIFGTEEDIPRFKFTEMIDDLAEVYSVKNASRYLIDNTEAIAAMKQAKQNAMNPNDKPPIEYINYKDAPGDIKAQMEAEAGFKPSQMHELEMQSRGGQIGTEQAQLLNAGTGQAPVEDPNAQGVPVNG